MSDDEGQWKIAEVWRRMREPWWGRWGIDLAIVGLILLGVLMFQTRNLVGNGEQIPEVQLETVDGEVEPIVSKESDKTLIYFWATWCGVCSAENGTVDWARSLLGDGVAVRSVVLDHRGPQAVQAAVDEKGIEYPVLLGNRRVQQLFNVTSFPTFYVLSKKGEVLRKSVGYTTTLGLVGRAWF